MGNSRDGNWYTLQFTESQGETTDLQGGEDVKLLQGPVWISP